MPAPTYGAHMDARREVDKAADGAAPECDHLDEDAEALEDPVHAGDARHQHERHEQQRAGTPGES